MKKIKLYIHNKEFNKKPNAYETSTIVKQIPDMLTTCSVKDLAENLEKGKTVVLPEFKNNKLSSLNDIVNQSVFMLDFDNSDLNNLYTIEDLEQDEFINNNASFFYKTFSSNDDVDRFRVVFILEDGVNRNIDSRRIYDYLLNKYKQADQVCFNTNRLFYGGYEYQEIDFNNYLDISMIDFDNQEYVEEYENLKNENKIYANYIDVNKPIYKLLEEHKYNEVKEIIKEKYDNDLCLKFDNAFTAVTTLQSMIDMTDFLDLPESSSFIDVLYDENEPSASVFRHKNGFDLYKVFSSSRKYNYDLVNFISKITGINNRYKAILLLVDIVGASIVYNYKINEITNQIEFFSKTIQDTELLKEQYPNIYSIIRYYNLEMSFVLLEMLNYVSEDLNGNVRVINFMSIDTVTNKLNKMKKTSRSKTQKVIDILTFFDLIKKLKDSEIPEKLLNKLVDNKKNSGYLRRSNVYEITNVDFETLERLDLKCEELKKIKFTIASNLNGEFLYRNYGADEALRVFPQFKSHKSETLSNDIGEVISNTSLELERKATKYIMTKINKNKYVLEEDIKKYLKKYFNNSYSEYKFKTIRISIIDSYDLKRVKFSKEIKEDLDIKKDYRNKFIYILN